MFSSLFSKIILSLILGGTIGLERESSNQGSGSLGGIRTYALIALSGSLAGVLVINGFTTLSAILSGSFFFLLISYYIVSAYIHRDFGLTSELSAIITFLIGLLLVLNIIPIKIIVALFVILILILSQKTKSKQLISGISQEELQAFISYAIIALVVLPFLPDITYQLQDMPILPELLRALQINVDKLSSLDLINPRKIWFIVVLITGIDVFGHLLGRILGNKKGFTLASFLAGFVSSTSTTQSLAQKSNRSAFTNHLVGAAILANVASFLQIFLLIGPLNPQWLIYIIPNIILMILAGGLIALAFLKKKEPDDPSGQEIKQGKIFSLMPALKFATLLIAVKIITKVSLLIFGESGFIISSVIASFAGLDAILVNLAEMAGQTITFKFAAITFLLVNATNLLSKSVYAFLQGTRPFAFKFALSAVAIITSSCIWLLIA